MGSASSSASGTSFIARGSERADADTVKARRNLLKPIEQECSVDHSQSRHGRGTIDQDADLDLAGRDHLQVDAGVGERLEHGGGDAGVGAHAQADDRDLGDLGVVSDLGRADLARGGFGGAQGLGQVALWPR